MRLPGQIAFLVACPGTGRRVYGNALQICQRVGLNSRRKTLIQKAAKWEKTEMGLIRSPVRWSAEGAISLIHPYLDKEL